MMIWQDRNMSECFKVFYVKLYEHSLVDKLKWFYENARCYSKIYRPVTHYCFNQGFINTFVIARATCDYYLITGWLVYKTWSTSLRSFCFLWVIPHCSSRFSSLWPVVCHSCVVHLRREAEFYTHIKQGSSLHTKVGSPRDMWSAIYLPKVSLRVWRHCPCNFVQSRLCLLTCRHSGIYILYKPVLFLYQACGRGM